MTSSKIDSAQDVVTFLKGQHEQIKSLFDDVLKAQGSERSTAFDTLRRLLAVHETAEEEVVHPRARHALNNGEGVVSARLKEEHDAKEELAAIEKMDVDSTEFEAAIRKFREAVEAHAEAEEREEFAQLATELGDDQLQGMRRVVELAERTAPTHPHAGVESASANLLAGPFASMLVRARDLITGKTGS